MPHRSSRRDESPVTTGYAVTSAGTNRVVKFDGRGDGRCEPASAARANEDANEYAVATFAYTIMLNVRGLQGNQDDK